MKNSVIILAGGQGKRMKTDMPKALCEVLGKPMLQWVIEACENADLKNICVVKGFAGEYIDSFLNGKYQTALQADRLGTGHAVMQAVNFLRENSDGNTLILCGDAPFIDSKTIKNALKFHQDKKLSVTVVTSVLENPYGYGRIIRTENGISGIVEERDCTEEQKKIKEINSGCFWFQTKDLLDVLFSIKPDNAQGEYYLTDCISLLIKNGKSADAYISENENVSLGANDRRGLLHLNDVARRQIINKHLDNGIEFTCTDGVSISNSVKIGIGTVIHSGVILKGNTEIGNGCEIGPNTYLNDTKVGRDTKLNNVVANESVIGNGVTIGPWVQLRPNTHIANGAKIGDFVEIKNSNIGEGTAVAHLTYVGDSDVIGCEIGGAVKNVIALCCGVTDGLGLGDNTKAALITRGLSEITRLGVALGGKKETFSGLAGLGDLVVTCTSIHSRNYRAGVLIGKGTAPEEAVRQVGTVEGYACAKATLALAEKYGVKMPITEEINQILFNGQPALNGISDLMSRPMGAE